MPPGLWAQPPAPQPGEGGAVGRKRGERPLYKTSEIIYNVNIKNVGPVAPPWRDHQSGVSVVSSPLEADGRPVCRPVRGPPVAVAGIKYLVVASPCGEVTA